MASIRHAFSHFDGIFPFLQHIEPQDVIKGTKKPRMRSRVGLPFVDAASSFVPQSGTMADRSCRVGGREAGRRDVGGGGIREPSGFVLVWLEKWEVLLLSGQKLRCLPIAGRNVNVKTNVKIDLEHVLKVLSSFEQEIHWDDYWDTLKIIDETYSMLIPRLRQALADDTEVVKLYALDALRRIGVKPQDLIAEIAILLKDENYYVRSEGINFIAECQKTNSEEITRALVGIIKSSREYLGLRLKALLLLIKFSGGFFCI